MQLNINELPDLSAIPLEGFAIAPKPITLAPTHLSPAESTACNTS